MHDKDVARRVVDHPKADGAEPEPTPTFPTATDHDQIRTTTLRFIEDRDRGVADRAFRLDVDSARDERFIRVLEQLLVDVAIAEAL